MTNPSDQSEQNAQTQPTDHAGEPVLVDLADGVATVTLNRPEAMNSLNDELKVALLATLEDLAEDPEVRALVLTGAGRAFCVGQDLKEHVKNLDDPDSSLATTVVDHYNPIVTLLSTMNKPVIAALNGVAAGAGMSFALACDFRIAVDGVSFNSAFASIALSCDSGASWALPRLVGTAKAKELLMMPRTVPTAEAVELGLLTKVVPAEQFEAAVREFAATLAAGPTLAYGSIRRAIGYSASHDLSQSLARESELMGLTGASSDHRAAVKAFLNKEKAEYTGS